MNRIVTALLFCLLAALLLTGCAAERPSNASSSQNSSQNESDQPQLSDNTPDSTPVLPPETPSVPETPTASENPAPSYYGTWEVTGLQATCQIFALSEEEIEAKTGLAVSYSAEECVTADGTIYSAPVYTEETTTAAALQEGYRVNPADLGISGEIQTVSVEGSFDLGGALALIKDADTLILYQDGVWFQATRTK